MWRSMLSPEKTEYKGKQKQAFTFTQGKSSNFSGNHWGSEATWTIGRSFTPGGVWHICEGGATHQRSSIGSSPSKAQSLTEWAIIEIFLVLLPHMAFDITLCCERVISTILLHNMQPTLFYIPFIWPNFTCFQLYVELLVFRR